MDGKSYQKIREGNGIRAWGENGVSGIRESNPPPRLGKPVHYRCANSAFRADTGTRTRDLRITNALLYQLSHIGETFAKILTKK